MLRQSASLLRATTSAIVLLFGWSAVPSAHGQIGGRGSGSGVVVCPGGCYGGPHPCGTYGYGGAGYYGFFRRYWAYGAYGPTYLSGPPTALAGFEKGCGLVYQTPTHGTGCCGPDGAGPPIAPYGGWGYDPYPPPRVESATSAAQGSAPPARPDNAPPRDDAARLQIVVPKDAEVIFDGGKTNQTGPIREFVTPTLTPGKRYSYKISVRYTDAKGKKIDDTRSIRLRANDRYRIDFTQPAPAEQLLPPLPSLPKS